MQRMVILKFYFAALIYGNQSDPSVISVAISDSINSPENSEIDNNSKNQIQGYEPRLQDENQFELLKRFAGNSNPHIFREGFNVHVAKHNHPSSDVNFKRDFEHQLGIKPLNPLETKKYYRHDRDEVEDDFLGFMPRDINALPDSESGNSDVENGSDLAEDRMPDFRVTLGIVSKEYNVKTKKRKVVHKIQNSEELDQGNLMYLKKMRKVPKRKESSLSKRKGKHVKHKTTYKHKKTHHGKSRGVHSKRKEFSPVRATPKNNYMERQNHYIGRQSNVEPQRYVLSVRHQPPEIKSKENLAHEIDVRKTSIKNQTSLYKTFENIKMVNPNQFTFTALNAKPNPKPETPAPALQVSGIELTNINKQIPREPVKDTLTSILSNNKNNNNFTGLLLPTRSENNPMETFKVKPIDKHVPIKEVDKKIVTEKHDDSKEHSKEKAASDDVSRYTRESGTFHSINRRRCSRRKSLKLCRKACRSAYKSVCSRLRCSSKAKKDFKYQCKKNCQRSFRSSRYSTE